MLALQERLELLVDSGRIRQLSRRDGLRMPRPVAAGEEPLSRYMESLLGQSRDVSQPLVMRIECKDDRRLTRQRREDGACGGRARQHARAAPLHTRLEVVRREDEG